MTQQKIKGSEFFLTDPIGSIKFTMGRNMIKKPINCWEYKGCGREPDGKKVNAFGTCPAATEKSIDGIHRGDNAGRACWIIAGTFCGGEIQGSYATKSENCSECDFFNLVLEEEKTSVQEATHLLKALSIVSR